MPTYLSGNQTSSAQNANTIVREVDEQIYHLEPEVTPLTALLNLAKQDEEVENSTFYYQSQQLMERWAYSDGGGSAILAATTSVPVDDSTFINIGDIIKNPATGEQMLCTAKADSTHFTATRGFGATSAANIADNQYLLIVGNASAENADTPAAISRDIDTDSNYTQIFRRSMNISGTAQATKYYSGNLQQRLLRELGMEFAKDMELSALFGEKKSGTTRVSGGLRPFISTNVYNAAGTLTEDNFEKNFLEPLFRYGSSEKAFFCSPRLCSTVDFWGRSKLVLNVDDNMSAVLGCRVLTYTSTHGELKVIRHKLLENSYSGAGFAVDMKNFRRVHLKGRKPQLKMNRQGNGIDGFIHEMIGEVGWKPINEKTHGFIYGVTGGA